MILLDAENPTTEKSKLSYQPPGIQWAYLRILSYPLLLVKTQIIQDSLIFFFRDFTSDSQGAVSEF